MLADDSLFVSGLYISGVASFINFILLSFT